MADAPSLAAARVQRDVRKQRFVAKQRTGATGIDVLSPRHASAGLPARVSVTKHDRCAVTKARVALYPRFEDGPESLFTLTVQFHNRDARNNSLHTLQSQSFFYSSRRAVRVALVKTPGEDAGGAASLMRETALRGRLRPMDQTTSMWSSYKTSRETEPVPESELDFNKRTLAFGRSVAVTGMSPIFGDFEVPFPILRSKIARLSLVVQLVHVHGRKQRGNVTVLGQRVLTQLDKAIFERSGTVWGHPHTGAPKLMAMQGFTDSHSEAGNAINIAIRFSPLTFKELYVRVFGSSSTAIAGSRLFGGVSPAMRAQLTEAYTVPGCPDLPHEQERVQQIGRDVTAYHEQLYHAVLKLVEEGLYEDVSKDLSHLRNQARKGANWRKGRKLLLRIDSVQSGSTDSAGTTGIGLFQLAYAGQQRHGVVPRRAVF
eukprot:g2498.t1